MKIEREMIGGVSVHVREGTPDRRVARSCLVEGEFDILKTILPRLKANFIIDAGGYIGTAAIALARSYPKAKIVTIEASSDNFQVLKMNVAPYANIIPVHAALVGTLRDVKLQNRGTGEWGFTTIEQPRDNPEAAFMESVPGITIPEIMRRHKASSIDILKLDIEGGEIDVLATSGDWLDRTTILLAELHERIIKGCKSAFQNASKGRQQIAVGKEKLASVAPGVALPAVEPAAAR
jgi:FkbM family methyltransferase